MQVSFHLRKDKLNKAGKAPVRMLITSNGSKIFKSVSGVKVAPANWDSKKERIIPSKKTAEYNFHIEFNLELDNLERRVNTIYRYFLLNEMEPTKENILNKLDNNKDLSLKTEFWSSFDDFIEKSKTTKAKRTVTSYVTVYRYLKEFEDRTNYDLTFDSINDKFFEQIQDYSFLIREIKNSYFSSIIKVLKTFMNWSFKRKLHSSVDYQTFVASEDETEVIFLTMDELMKLFHFDFKLERHQKARDVYCFQCFSSLRYSDIEELSCSNIYSDHIRINIKKTKTTDHIIPLIDHAKTILEKYKDTIYEPLPKISSQNFNTYIKECCEIVGIDSPTQKTRYVGQKRITKTFKKFELITSHTARKTFVTNSLIMGMSPVVVKSISGHKKESSFKKYVNISDQFKQQEVDKTWNKV